MAKPLPTLTTDAEAEAFIANADLTHYDLSTMRPAGFEFAPKTAQINMRLPAALLDAVKTVAGHEGIPYTRFIRRAIEHAVAPGQARGAD